ncbi:Rne/Rng family ribonuclease [Cupriavidus taiwanensis]|uniref:Ribonuclease E n=1 Tax=Cupriavidus taiwanensis TaxID=164546 RepID=A0A7Z7NMH5_9BURK|nr:Rne/Rng family ribonuclease [Cupriavidus taiwanensis]SOY88380.1 Ribonuclease E [Cupriavidus taiwanensis]SOZ05928.1 Ribonuclease E [Cupriavidus taiwanensis]SOZ07913.1 Ribonuclease E [Cupriavidus taiwanensis]SPC15949.1 Ribonuclease E [Cupriavidus taiwanensis]SPD40626.1 fused ribonucleaseE: endoribonuclease; RNA-binding protein; RNA degradosome binding protein [Cupriavidus taiwanensis]
MKRMLFNATQQEELRVAIVDGQKLIDIDIETAGREQRKGNIYKGVITRIEPSLEACFVNYGEERHGFLPFKEVARAFFKEGIDVRNARIQDALHEGQELIVQVEKEERGNKGAALTTFISLAGRYLVLMPNNPRGGGVSRRIEGEDRQELRETMAQLTVPEGMSIIARTAGIGRSAEELQWDLNYLLQLWKAIDGAAGDNKAPLLIYLESSLVIRAIRDYFQPDIGEILIDTDEIYEQARAFMSVVMPDNMNRVKKYRDDVPLFSRFQIEHQIESAYSRMVMLPSGGAIVIDHTEALVSVDVNSARATKGADIEETALRTNLEAADEIARQLRLRDLGGLIVIDFIDMESGKAQKDVETRLKDALRHDRARVQMGKISRFGLMELSRQRLRPSLSEGSHITCPRCNGTGHIRDTESSALQVLRIIQEEAMKENTAAIHCQVPVEVAAFLLNEKRQEINLIELRFKVNVLLIPNKHLETPHYKLERLRHDDPRLEDSTASYKMAEAAAKELEADTSYSSRRKEEAKPRQEAAVKGITPEQPAPVSVPRPERAPRPEAAPVAPPVPATKPVEAGGFIAWLKGLFGARPATPPVVEPAKPAAAAETRSAEGRRERGPRGEGRGQRGERAERGERGERTERGERQGRGQRGERAERGERTERAERGDRQAGERGEQREGRGERPGRQPRQQGEGQATPAVARQAEAVPAERAQGERAEARQEGRRDRNQERRERQRERQRERSELREAEAGEAPQPEAIAAAQALGVLPQAVPEETQARAELPEGAEAAAETAEGEERRRRNRRGRNRYRRERDESAQGASGEGESEGAAAEGFAPASAEAGVTAEPAPQAAVAAPVAAEAVEAIRIAVPADVTPAPAAEAAPVAEPVAAPAAETVAPVAVAVTEAVAAEAIAEPAISAAVETAAPVVPAAAPAPAQAPVLAPQAEAAPAAEPAAPAPAAAAPAVLENLEPMLASAGLQWVHTDSDKLRSAQEAAARIVPAPRVPRERKPLPPLPQGPMILVETGSREVQMASQQ